jgi:rhamnose utilization protein RhaD (predicted bifunctional aldolase and dehydrogenase)
MKCLWDDGEATQHAGDLAQRVYTSHLLGREKSLILQCEGGTSVKIKEKNVFGEEVDILYVSSADRDLESIEVESFWPMRRNHLARLAKLDSLSDMQLANEIPSTMVNVSAPALLLEAILHAVVPYKYVDHAYADAVLAIANTPGGLERVREIYGDSVVVIPYARSGFPLAKLCAEVFSSEVGEDTIGLVLMQQGIVSFGETAKVSYERIVDLVTRAEQVLACAAIVAIDRGARPVSIPIIAAPDKPMRNEIAALRQAVSASAGFPVILSTHTM